MTLNIASHRIYKINDLLNEMNNDDKNMSYTLYNRKILVKKKVLLYTTNQIVSS